MTGEQTGWATVVHAAEWLPCSLKPAAADGEASSCSLQPIDSRPCKGEAATQGSQLLKLGEYGAVHAGHANSSRSVVSWRPHEGQPVLSMLWVPGLAPHVVATANLHGCLRLWSVAALLQVHRFSAANARHIERASSRTHSAPSMPR